MLKSILLTVVWAGLKSLYRNLYQKYLKYRIKLSDRMAQHHRQREEALVQAERQEQHIEEAGQAAVEAAPAGAEQQAADLAGYKPNYGDQED